MPAIFVCLAMIVSQIRPFSEMPPLELSTNMFLEAAPYEHYLAFAVDDPRSVMSQDMTERLIKYPGVGKWTSLSDHKGTFNVKWGSISFCKKIVSLSNVVYERDQNNRLPGKMEPIGQFTLLIPKKAKIKFQLNFQRIFRNRQKQIVPCKNTAKEWSLHCILFTDWRRYK